MSSLMSKRIHQSVGAVVLVQILTIPCSLAIQSEFPSLFGFVGHGASSRNCSTVLHTGALVLFLFIFLLIIIQFYN